MARVSIITPLYNHEKYITRAIESVLQQTFKNWEYWIIDDGSTDRGPEIAKAYADRHPDKIFFTSQQNLGQEKTRNNALQRSRGEFICLLDSDDYFHPHKLELLLKEFENPKVGLAYGKTEILYGEKIYPPRINNFSQGDVYEALLQENFVGASAVLICRECFFVGETQKRFFDSRFQTMGEYPLWLDIAREWEFAFVPEVVAVWRFHGENQSSRLALEARKELVDFFSELLQKYPTPSHRRAWVQRKYDYACELFQAGRNAEARQEFKEILYSRFFLKAGALALVTTVGTKLPFLLTTAARLKKSFWNARNRFDAERFKM